MIARIHSDHLYGNFEMMKRIPSYLKNKYIIATAIVLVYTLFLDDHDVFTMLRNKRKLNKISMLKEETAGNLKEARSVLNKLNEKSEVEKFAREKKFFKRDDEDIFVIFYED